MALSLLTCDAGASEQEIRLEMARLEEAEDALGESGGEVGLSGFLTMGLALEGQQ